MSDKLKFQQEPLILQFILKWVCRNQKSKTKVHKTNHIQDLENDNQKLNRVLWPETKSPAPAVADVCCGGGELDGVWCGVAEADSPASAVAEIEEHYVKSGVSGQIADDVVRRRSNLFFHFTYNFDFNFDLYRCNLNGKYFQNNTNLVKN